MKYSDKLKDPKWLQFAEKIKERDGLKCTACGCRNDSLQAHHISYLPDREPWEYDDRLDLLTTLCAQCHSSVHELLSSFQLAFSRDYSITGMGTVEVFCRALHIAKGVSTNPSATAVFELCFVISKLCKDNQRVMNGEGKPL